MTTQIEAVEADLALKAKHRGMWALGDYPRVATEIIPDLGSILVDAAGVAPGDRVLDVAAGAGNAAIPAALAGASVVASDLTPELLDVGRASSAALGAKIRWDQADAEALPYDDGEFDAVLSCVGVMFAPHHQASADELVRVCRPGGTIGLLSWTPEGFIGQMFRVIGKYLPPPTGIKSPALWGTRVWMDQAFGPAASVIIAKPRMFNFRYYSPHHFLDIFREYYGPLLKAFEALDASGQKALARDILALIGEMNLASDGTMVVPGEYLEVVLTRR